MTTSSPKQPRLQLEKDAYQELFRQVLRRDRWRCQQCGRRTELHVHHRRSRSHGGDDSESNLITLCATCHNQLHDGC